MSRQAIIGIAIAAGLASGLMAAAGFRPTPLAMPLLIGAPLAVYIASLGWGPVAGSIAALGGSAVVLGWHGPEALVIASGLLFVPAAVAGHLANLAQPAPSGSGMIWYPLPMLLLRLMAVLALGFIASGIVMGYEPQSVIEAFKQIFREIMASDPALEMPSDELIARNAAAYAAMLPAVVPGMMLLAHVLVMHFAAIIASRSGLLARPAEDLATTFVLPRFALAIPLAGFAAMVALPHPAYEIAAIAAGLGTAAFALGGLAELHRATRGRPGRQALLAIAYLTLVVFGFPVLIFAVMGAVRTLRRAPQSPSGPPDRPTLH
jgi:hypothetical protein